MSRALDYLLQTRGETLAPYFKFLKQAGSNLDPKTRSLISLIAKVHAQSESGLRQYLPRALRDGASSAEIIDLLLFSLPMLGLSKITWAIDIILDMDIPDFNAEQIDQQPDWHPLATVAEIAEGVPEKRGTAGREFFILKEQQQLKIYDSRCPHQVTNIPELAIKGFTLTCPKHNWQFDLHSGDCIAKGRLPLTRLQHRISDQGVIEVFC